MKATMQTAKVVEHAPVLCPALNKEIAAVDCYETKQGISNILAPIGVDDEAMLKVCRNCAVGKRGYAEKR